MPYELKSRGGKYCVVKTTDGSTVKCHSSKAKATKHMQALNINARAQELTDEVVQLAVLKAKQRKKLPKSSFGLPGKRKYPLEDRAHAANAKARAKQMLKKGKLSRSAYNRIVAKANRILGRKNPT